jgi:hypothetical protein
LTHGSTYATLSQRDALVAHHGEHCTGDFIALIRLLAAASPTWAKEKDGR